VIRIVNNLKELYRYRVLIQSLVVRELKARYRGTVLGFLWSFFNPLLLMIVYTAVFGLIINPRDPAFESRPLIYALYLFCGILPWQWFASSTLESANVLMINGNLIKKILFPAEVLPVVTVTANTVNFILTLPLLFAFLLAFRVPLGPPLLALPILIAIEFILTVGLALIGAALNIHFRDLQHIVLHVITVLQFLTPVFYPASLIPEPLRPWVFMNPLALLVSAFHDVLYFNRLPSWPPLLGLLAGSGVVLSLATVMFNRYKRTFAEAL
jgi:ABC-type polysaccharide/polyol phosphate export permease